MFYFFLLCFDLIVKSFKVTIENIKAAHFWPLCGNQTVTGGSQHHILRQRTKICISTFHHYSDIIMRTMTSQITSVSFLLTVCSCVDKKHQSSAALAFVSGIHWWPVNSPRKGQRRKWVHLMTSSYTEVHAHVPLLQCQTDCKSFRAAPLPGPSAGSWCFHGYATWRCQTSSYNPATWFPPKILKWRWISAQIEMVFSWKLSLREYYDIPLDMSSNGSQMGILKWYRHGY